MSTSHGATGGAYRVEGIRLNTSVVGSGTRNQPVGVVEGWRSGSYLCARHAGSIASAVEEVERGAQHEHTPFTGRDRTSAPRDKANTVIWDATSGEAPADAATSSVWGTWPI